MSPPSPPDPAPAADGPDWTGRIIAGRYRVEAVLGVGGMGTAYRARDERTNRLVVLKVPHARHFSEGESRGRFQDEIRKLLEIEHPHVVKVFDVGDEDGTPYAVFPFLAGGSLGARMKALGQRFTPDEVVPWLAQIADALDDLHARGDVHRDVKPDNILFDKPLGKGKANAYLADFGLAKALGLDPSRIFQSRTGTVLGTQAYMAPEQFNQRAKVTGAVDQYALATTVYQALSGQMPFTVSSAEELVFEKVAGTPRPLSEVAQHVPAAIERAVMRALSADPKARFGTCAEFAEALDAAVSTKPAPPAAAPPAAAPPTRKVEPARAPAGPPPARAAKSPSPPARATQPAPRRAPAAAAPAGPRVEPPPTRRRSRVPWIAAAVAILGGLGGAGLLLGWFRDGEFRREIESAGTGRGAAASPAVTSPTPREATPSDATPPAPSPSPDTPVAPVVAPPRHLATLAAAEEAGRRGDWASVATGIQQARAEGAPAIPEWLETGLADHLAPPTLEVLEPTEGGEVEEGTVRVRGRFVSKRPGDVLRVDGSVVAAAGGTFEAGVEKTLGPQTVAFEVRDGAEVRASVARTFFVRPSRRGVPGWAHVADDQILAARAAGVPVAFENRLRMRFVYVPAGTFRMGSPETELFHEDDEPLRAVTLARPFYVAVTEATWAQSDGWNPADPDGAKAGAGAVQVETPPADRTMPRPIRRFTDAAAFAAWVGQRDAPRRYRIPREDEWEYAARATTETPFPVGDLMTSDDANVDGERPYGASPKSAYRRRLLPVGRFMHNPWGLYDVLGSLWEWTEAVTVPGGASASASGAPTPVLRGGAYVSAVRDARSANRAAVRDGESDVAGVRLILDPAGVR